MNQVDFFLLLLLLFWYLAVYQHHHQSEWNVSIYSHPRDSMIENRNRNQVFRILFQRPFDTRTHSYGRQLVEIIRGIKCYGILWNKRFEIEDFEILNRHFSLYSINDAKNRISYKKISLRLYRKLLRKKMIYIG